MLPSMGLAMACLTRLIAETYSATPGWVRNRMRAVTWLAALLIPAGYILLQIFLVALLRSKGAFIPPLQIPFYMVAASLLLSTFADDIAGYLERRRPDEEG